MIIYTYILICISFGRLSGISIVDCSAHLPVMICVSLTSVSAEDMKLPMNMMHGLPGSVASKGGDSVVVFPLDDGCLDQCQKYVDQCQ